MKTRDGRTPAAVAGGRPGPATAELGVLPADPGPPFESLDSSHDYVARLLQVVEETAAGVGEDLRLAPAASGRRREALQLVAWKLDQLRFHLAASRRRLSDLAALRPIVEAAASAA